LRIIKVEKKKNTNKEKRNMSITTNTTTNAITHTSMQRRCRRNELFVNSLKMQSGCTRCQMIPQSASECRLLDLNHNGGGRIGAWAEKSTDKTADVSRLVWSGASLQRIADELAKGSFLCKNCHAMEHVENRPVVQDTDSWAAEEIQKFNEKNGV
jgi:hypothetical protein